MSSEESHMRLMSAGLDMIERAIDHSAAGRKDAPAVAGPECCANCVHWGGGPRSEYGLCGIMQDWETPAEGVCTAFQLKARL